jgi:RNA polymerase sigma factor (sigma-70 family)
MDMETLDATVDELSPERRLSGRQELLKLAKALDTLSDKCRNVVWLRRVEGLSQKQTAERLGLNEGAVESQLTRGIRSLAAALFGATREDSAVSLSEKVRREPEQR